MMYGTDAMEPFFVNTNAQLKEHGFKEMKGYSEAIKFHGIMQLCTRFEFSDQDKLLWSTKSENKFIDPPNFWEEDRYVSRLIQGNLHLPTLFKTTDKATKGCVVGAVPMDAC